MNSGLHIPFQSEASAQQHEASVTRPSSTGFVRLKSTPLRIWGSHNRALPAALQALQLKPYAQTLELLRKQQNILRKRERDPYLLLNIAWISLASSPVEFNRRTLESFELSLAHTLFLESTHPQQSVEAVCSEGHFDVIVLEAPLTPVILKRAQRWLKPSTHNPMQPQSANGLENAVRDRLFIALDETRGRT
ncbi:MAG: hypothetical protein RI932_2070 [Pseudomonadota bacterium]|jgi:hypothetical protein